MKSMDEGRAAILKFDYWECKLCSVDIDAGSSVGSDNDKTQILVAHIKKEHFDNPSIDPTIDDKYLVLYFRGMYPHTPAPNVKTNDVTLLNRTSKLL